MGGIGVIGGIRATYAMGVEETKMTILSKEGLRVWIVVTRMGWGGGSAAGRIVCGGLGGLPSNTNILSGKIEGYVS